MAGNARLAPWRPPAVNGDLGQTTELAREKFDVGPCTPVDIRRILASKQRDLDPVRGRCRVVWNGTAQCGIWMVAPGLPLFEGNSDRQIVYVDC